MLRKLFFSSGAVGVLIAIAAGLATGLAGYTFLYAKGASYLTNDPAACANCHIMREQFDGWSKGSHKNVARCNDCHAPHELVPKYYTKARNGFFHSLYFTTGRFHEPIEITQRNREVTEQACRSCHQEIVQAIESSPNHAGTLSCIRCHPSVGHME